MITVRKSNERGLTKIDWLDSRHTFSFGEYYDPAEMGFSVLRVINDDRVAPGAGFPTHPHRDMEIVTWVLDGALEHRDSMGNGSVIRPGDAQRMSAGRGIRHSEFNASKSASVHLLQMWMLPAEMGIEPGYEQRNFREAERRGKLKLIASPDGSGGSITVHQDARLYDGLLSAGDAVRHEITPKRHAYLHVARGSVAANGLAMGEGDGAAIENEPGVELKAQKDSEILLFDLP
ncbi:MAG: pirin family protein [Candidatus Binataceae bacterium]